MVITDRLMVGHVVSTPKASTETPQSFPALLFTILPLKGVSPDVFDQLKGATPCRTEARLKWFRTPEHVAGSETRWIPVCPQFVTGRLRYRAVFLPSLDRLSRASVRRLDIESTPGDAYGI
jgi:hypothetical protein